MKVPSFFNNKIVQYVFLALAVMNILGYLSTGAYECLLVFAVGYALTDNYCRNRSCSILGALFAANFVWGCGRVKETFVETMKGAKEHATDASESATKAALEAMKEGADKEATDSALEAAKAAAKSVTDMNNCEGSMKDAGHDGYMYMKDGDTCSAKKA